MLSQSEPKSYSEVIKSAEWHNAINEELTALEVNDTWKLVPLPHDR